MDFFSWSLVEICQIGASNLGRVLGLIASQESCFDLSPVFLVQVLVMFQRVPPGESVVSKDSVKFFTLTFVGVPIGDVGGVFQAIDQIHSRDRVPGSIPVEQGKFGRSTNLVMGSESREMCRLSLSSCCSWLSHGS